MRKKITPLWVPVTLFEVQKPTNDNKIYQYPMQGLIIQFSVPIWKY